MSRRVAYLINQYPMVSHAFIRREILALERRGVEVARFALRGWDSRIVDAIDADERNRTRYVLQEGVLPLMASALKMLLKAPKRFLCSLALALRMSWKAERPLPYHLAYLAEACRLVPWLQAAGVSHLHAHFGSNSAEVAMLAHALGGPTYSFTVHGPTEFDKPGMIGLGEKIRRAAFVVAITSYCRSQLYRWVDHSHWPKVKVVHCGLEDEFHSNEASPPGAAPRLVCIGRLVEQKGQLLLIEAARRLAAIRSDFQLVLVGDGPLRGEIEALVSRLDLGGRVRMAGAVSTEQLRAEILAARALVLPSFAEGLPMVIMEAMALRRPVIATYIAGIPELVRPSIDGWLVPAGSVDALADAMEDCLDRSPEALQVMGEAAHERALARHAADRQAAELAELFGTVGTA